METILVAWSSWFIGFHLSRKLLEKGYQVVWIDNENDYYDVTLKKARREVLQEYKWFSFCKWDITDLQFIEEVFSRHKIDKVATLAAQAGVRYSFENPYAFINTNIVGYHNLIHMAKVHECSNFVYASTWSVYGENNWKAWELTDSCVEPLSLYAATKKSDELIAHSYSHLHWLQTIGLRFFNVVWSWWRPDAAYYIFTNNILKWKPIKVYNHGKMKRNNTYVWDIVDGIIKSLEYDNWGKYEVLNLWNEKEVDLMYFIECIEKRLWIIAKKEYIEIQPGEVTSNSVNSSVTYNTLWRKASVQIEEMLDKAVDWQRSFYNL